MLKVDFIERIQAHKARIGVVGLGYVGLPLVLRFGEERFPVLGFDVDPIKVRKLNAGESYIRHIPAERVQILLKEKQFEATSDFSRLAEADCIIPVSSTRAAELVKLLENIYRSVNIALVNELKLLADRMDIDIWEVIDAASTKPFGFTPFYPGPGLGGHCIPIDPFYLSWKAKEYDFSTRFIQLAGEINTAIPHYVVERIGQALNDRSKSIRGSRILLLGVA